MPGPPTNDGAMAAALRDLAGSLRHDVARYVALQCRWLGPDASPADRRAALRDDLLATRRGPDGSVELAVVFGPFRAALTGAAPLASGATIDLREDPSVSVLLAAIGRAEQISDRLRRDDLPDDDLAAAVGAAIAASDAARAAVARLHELARDHG